MTYVPTWEGFLYLAVVTDVFSRKVVGWAFGVQMTADLVIAALDMALFTRNPKGVIHQQRPRQPVHQHCLWQPLQGDECAPLDGHGRGCV